MSSFRVVPSAPDAPRAAVAVPDGAGPPGRPSRRALLRCGVAAVTAGLLATALAPSSATAAPVGRVVGASAVEGRVVGASAVEGRVVGASVAQAAFTLPEPSGRYPIGAVDLHLIDRSRTDPWVPGNRKRELMISLRYPTPQPAGHRRAPWLAPGEAGPVGRDFVKTFTGTERDLSGLAEVATHGRVGAPVMPRRGGWPVVLFSPGFGAERNSDAAVVEDLASRGYLVVTIDHPHDAMAVEFPGGRVERNTIEALLEQDPDDAEALAERVVAVRVADTRFVLDQLEVLACGGNPDPGARQLPQGLAGAFQLTGVGMFGHSMGGATAAQAMLEDPRLVAGINLDGNLYGSVVRSGLDRPFLLVAAQDTTLSDPPSWGTFVAASRGWHRAVQVAGAHHLAFHDSVLMRGVLAKTPGITPAMLTDGYGTIDGGRAVTVQRAYVEAFFDLHLRHQDQHLFDGRSARFPEVGFLTGGVR